eukprot:2476240-Rhodomonas_salina.2
MKGGRRDAGLTLDLSNLLSVPDVVLPARESTACGNSAVFLCGSNSDGASGAYAATSISNRLRLKLQASVLCEKSSVNWLRYHIRKLSL